MDNICAKRLQDVFVIRKLWDMIKIVEISFRNLIGVIPICSKSPQRIVKELYDLIKANRHKKLKEQQQAITRKLQGIYQYFAIRGNYKFLNLIYDKALFFWYKMLNLRGGRKKSYNSNAFIEFKRIFALPKPRILHQI